MIKKLIVGVLLLAIGAGGVLGGLWYVNEKPETLNISEAINFSKSLITHSEDLTTAQGEVSTLSDQLETAQGEVSTLSDQLETAQGEVSTLSDQLETAQGALNDELLFIDNYYSKFGSLPSETLTLFVTITDGVSPSFEHREQQAGIFLKQRNLDGIHFLETTLSGCYRAIIEGQIQPIDISEFDWYNTDLEYIFSPYGSGNAIYTALNLALNDYVGGQYNIAFEDWDIIDQSARFNLMKIHSYIVDSSQNLDGYYSNSINLNIVASCSNDKIEKDISINLEISFVQTIYE